MTIPIIGSIADLAATSDAWICDVWGVLYNDAAAFPEAGAACVRFRAEGGRVVLVTNAPHPSAAVEAILDRIGIPRAAYDAIVTSGDVTRSLIDRYAGKRLHHLGPDRYLGVLRGLEDALVGRDAAEVIVCTGLLDDDHETPAHYHEVLAPLAERGVPFICVNPDIQVERGDRLVYCAGALAETYAGMGGPVAYAGKPHPPIYDRAMSLTAELLGRPASRDRLLAIGDGVRTDMAGAAKAGIRGVFVASALHFSHREALEPEALARLFADAPVRPVAAMIALRW